LENVICHQSQKTQNRPGHNRQNTAKETQDHQNQSYQKNYIHI
jgi:hypothetical protein